MKTPKRTPQKPNPPKKPAQQGELPHANIHAMAYGGYGVAKVGKRTVFIPYVIEGEQLTIAFGETHKGITYAQGKVLQRASADRVRPSCAHFGACWGCQWQHISPEAQRLIKFDLFAEQFQRSSQMSDAVLAPRLYETMPSPRVWGYNHHALFKLTTEAGVWGMARAGGAGIEPIVRCEVLHPELQDFYASLVIDTPNIQQFVLQRGENGVMLLLYLRDEDVPELDTDLPASVNVILPDNEPMNLFGDAFTVYQVGGQAFRVTAGAFMRPNVEQVGNLVRTMHEWASLQGNEAILDLYGGVGIFSAMLAPFADIVTLVESYPPAATDAEVNLEPYENVDIVEASVEEMLTELLADKAQYDLAIIDAPRGAMSDEALRDLLALGVSRLLVIAPPLELGALATAFLSGGYRLDKVQPFDFAPHTFATEGLALFVRIVDK